MVSQQDRTARCSFAEQDGNKIGRITTSGSITEYPIPTSKSSPESIATGPDGALWFTEIGANKIGRITTGGAVTEFPIPSPNVDPGGIAAGPDGALWFTEILNATIGRITTTGRITEFAISASSSSPYQLAAGADGALWFTDFGTNSIGRITTGNVGGLVATVLPSSRSVEVGNTATAFATIINSGSWAASGCAIVPVTPVPANFVYQTTNPATNR